MTHEVQAAIPNSAEVPGRQRRITRILVANRAEIATRVFRTARAMGIGTVAVYADPDADLPYVDDADIAVRLPGSSPEETYLRGDLILDAARRTGADAIHPGYGFLSENSGFAHACTDAGMTFIGPTPEVIEMMGSKIRAKKIMGDAGVPTLSWRHVQPDQDAAAIRAAADDVGYPLIVKASAGGGGRGMRVVETPADLISAIRIAATESRSAFGDDTMFIERYVANPRHIEVQVFGDRFGNVVSLFERECSIQRRHQKILEESPSPAVDDDLRSELSSAAVTAAKAIGYLGAGTVEFVLGGNGEFFFLEVNTRLQVEHPVTELVTGLDLVRMQIEIAAGQQIDSAVEAVRQRGHAVEARIYAENPESDFTPSIGLLSAFRINELSGVRVDSGYRSGNEVSPHYDAMLAKVIAWAPTREESTAKLALALDQSTIHGIRTNTDYLCRILRDPAFQAGATTTDFIVTRAAALALDPDENDQETGIDAIAATMACFHRDRTQVGPLRLAPGNWRNVGEAQYGNTLLTAAGGSYHVSLRYRTGEPRVSVNDRPEVAVRIFDVEIDSVTMELDGIRQQFSIGYGNDAVFVQRADHRTDFTIEPIFAVSGTERETGALTAQSPGIVVAVLAESKEQVVAGQPLVTIEAMKMQHQINAPTAGIIDSIPVAVGDQVQSGDTLAILQHDGSQDRP